MQDVRCIRSYIESLNDKPYVVYYKKQRLNIGENLRRFCFENEHIKVKSLEAKIFLNGKPISVNLKTVKTMEELRIECLKIMKLTVKQNVVDQNHVVVQNLDKFILETDKNRKLYFETKTPVGVSYSLGGSVSNIAKSNPNNITRHFKIHPLYAYHFCLQVYNKFCEGGNDEDKEFLTRFNRIKTSMSPLFQQYEPSYTSAACRELDRYLFKDYMEGCALHQPVIAGAQNHPDCLVVMSDYSRPLLVYDFKTSKDEIELARNESLGYCVAIFNAMRTTVRPLFVMPLSFDEAELYLCWPIGNGTIAQIDIYRGKPSADFFCAVRHAVRHAVRTFDFPHSNFNFNPFGNEVCFSNMVPGKDSILLGTDHTVYKFYDTINQPYARPNAAIVQEVLGQDYLKGICERELSVDQRFQYLSYKWIEITEDTPKLEDFKPIMRDLDKLHDAGYVHSDVRLCNMLFPKQTAEAKLIDFDLMDRVNQPYPQCYNDYTTLFERHHDAKGCQERKKVHDKHSLCYIILELFCECLSREQQEHLNFLQTNEDVKLMSFFDL